MVTDKLELEKIRGEMDREGNEVQHGAECGRGGEKCRAGLREGG